MFSLDFRPVDSAVNRNHSFPSPSTTSTIPRVDQTLTQNVFEVAPHFKQPLVLALSPPSPITNPDLPPLRPAHLYTPLSCLPLHLGRSGGSTRARPTVAFRSVPNRCTRVPSPADTKVALELRSSVNRDTATRGNPTILCTSRLRTIVRVPGHASRIRMEMDYLHLLAGGHRERGWGFLPRRLPYESTVFFRVQVHLILFYPSFTSFDPSLRGCFVCLLYWCGPRQICVRNDNYIYFSECVDANTRGRPWTSVCSKPKTVRKLK